MENEVEIDKARKTSRISRGLNPDAPRPPQPPKCKPSSTQRLLAMRKKLRPARWTKKQEKFKLWTSTRSPWRSSAIDSELTSKLV